MGKPTMWFTNCQEQVQQKPSCTSIEDDKRLEILDLESIESTIPVDKIKQKC